MVLALTLPRDGTTPQADSGHEPLKRFVPYYRDNRAELSTTLTVPINYRDLETRYESLT